MREPGRMSCTGWSFYHNRQASQMEKQKIRIHTKVNAPLAYVWKCWTSPSDIVQWNAASEDWHTPRATNDLRVGGKFKYRMEVRDGSMGFDFEGTYTAIESEKRIEYALDDDRKVWVLFREADDGILVEESFEAEDTHTAELQRTGWQAILDRFKKHVEAKAGD